MAREKEMIEVLYAITDKNGNYSKFVGTSMCSMFENTEEKVRVHIFHDGSIKEENRTKFETLAKNYGQELVFYNIRKLMSKVLKQAEEIMEKAVNDARYSEAALYRLLAPQVLPEEITRLIYLDADTLVNIDIKRLWKEKIGPNGMAAVLENDMLDHYHMRATSVGGEIKKLLDYWESLGVKIDDCFNSGVLLMDLEKIRPMGNLLLSGLSMALKCESENNFYDQNILNFYFAKDATHLPWNYNILQHWDREFKSSRNVQGIYHYMGRTLKMDENEERDTIYYDYFLKTPWAGGKFICHFYNKLEEIYFDRFAKRFRLMRKLAGNLASKNLVLAVSLEKQAEVAKMVLEPESFDFIHSVNKNTNPKVSDLTNKKKEKSKRMKEETQMPDLPEGVRFYSAGSDKKLDLNLPYDIDSYFYLFFVGDYIAVKIMLEEAGLEESGHYMDGSFLISRDFNGVALINPTKAFELM